MATAGGAPPRLLPVIFKGDRRTFLDSLGDEEVGINALLVDMDVPQKG